MKYAMANMGDPVRVSEVLRLDGDRGGRGMTNRREKEQGGGRGKTKRNKGHPMGS